MKKVALIITCLLSITTYGQFKTELSNLKNVRKDTIYVNKIIQLVSMYYRYYPSEMDSLLNIAIPIANDLAYKKGVNKLLFEKITISTDYARYDEVDSLIGLITHSGNLSHELQLRMKNCKVNLLVAKGELEQGGKLIKKGLDVNDEAQIELITNLARIYQLQGKYDSSLMYYNHSLSIATEKSLDVLPTIYINLAGVRDDMDDDKENAIETYKKAIDAALEVKDTLSWIYGKGNLCVIKMKKGNWIAALDMFNELFQEVVISNTPLLTQGWLYNCYGVCQLNLKQYQEAEETFTKVALIAGQTKNPLSQSRAIFNAGNALVRLGKYDEGFEKMKEAIHISRKAELLTSTSFILKKISEFYNLYSYPDSAYKFLSTHYELEDSLKEKETKLRYLEIQEKYDNVKLESEVSKASFKILLLITGVILLSLVITILMVNRKKKNFELLFTQKKLQLMKLQEANDKHVILQKDERIKGIKEQLAVAVGIEKLEMRELDFDEVIALTGLKPRHIKPLIALSSGITNYKEIAKQINMNVSTVQKYLQQIREDLRVSSTADIIPKIYETLDNKRK